jgi:hypothetical protein
MADHANTAEAVHAVLGKMAEIGANPIPAEPAIHRVSAEAIHHMMGKLSGDRRLTQRPTPWVPTVRAVEPVDFMRCPF